MKNFVQPGGTVTLPAPYAVNAGDGALVADTFGIACGTYANGADGEFMRIGVFDITALSTDVGAIGVKVYWDNTNKRITVTASTNKLVGMLAKAKANGETTARVILSGHPT
jgi:predicted RecA/RadA family phage recombinase